MVVKHVVKVCCNIQLIGLHDKTVSGIHVQLEHFLS